MKLTFNEVFVLFLKVFIWRSEVLGLAPIAAFPFTKR